MEEQKSNVLKVLFPEKEIPITDGQSVKVRPLSLKDMPKVIDAFGIVMKMAEMAKDPADVAMKAMRELLEILPYCIDRPPEEIPATVIPEIIETMIEQNVTDAALGKWKSLIQKVTGYVGAAEAIKNQGLESKT